MFFWINIYAILNHAMNNLPAKTDFAYINNGKKDVY